ncbi:uncharacterized protein LOC143686731 [Tamandua tetradactyla]|uniref:uncharacterized protein LOC143686731 n=1 Tax=Tamandua tetradactyla TaxID=48850 RepID=UPI0040548C69
MRMSKFATRGPLGALAHTRLQAQRVRSRCACANPEAWWVAPRLRRPPPALRRPVCRPGAPCAGHGRWRLSWLGGRWRWLLTLREPRRSLAGPGSRAFAWGRAAATESRRPDGSRSGSGGGGARPARGQPDVGPQSQFPVRVPARALGPLESSGGGFAETLRKVKVRKGPEGLTAGSSWPRSRSCGATGQPRAGDLRDAAREHFSSARRHCGSHGARARVSSGSHVPFSQGDVHRWMSCPMKRER